MGEEVLVGFWEADSSLKPQEESKAEAPQKAIRAMPSFKNCLLVILVLVGSPSLAISFG